ncbi:MAG TPA: nitrile hydratase subunit beta [Pseudonocardiaceae bacterium]
MDGVADLGGRHGWGRVPVPGPEPVFAEPWQGRAFALGALAARLSGTNLDAFRHALERLNPLDYLADGYFGRWARATELLLVDSGVLAPGAVTARSANLRGDVRPEPAPPQPCKPDYASTSPGSLREVTTAARFAVGDRVRTRDLRPAGHTRLAGYLRRRTGIIEALRPGAVLPDTHAHFRGENAQHVYAVVFESRELWGAEAEEFQITADLFEDYLEAAGG